MYCTSECLHKFSFILHLLLSNASYYEGYKDPKTKLFGIYCPIHKYMYLCSYEYNYYDNHDCFYIPHSALKNEKWCHKQLA